MAVTVVRLPHPVTLDGQAVREAPAGSTARELIDGWGDVVAAADGRLLGPGDLDDPLPDGAVLVARAAAAGGDDSNPLRAVLQIALLVAVLWIPGTQWFVGLSRAAQVATQAAIVVGGTLVVNAIAPPVLPSPGGAGAGSAPDPVYSLVGGANRARPYEPLLLVLGSHRVFPDLAAAEYTTFSSSVPGAGADVDGSRVRIGDVFSAPTIDAARAVRDATITAVPAELAKYDADPDLLVKLEEVVLGTDVVYEARRSNAWTVVVPPAWLRGQPPSAAPGGSTEQYLHQIFHFGLGDLDVEELRVADTPLADFEEVETQWPDPDGALTLVAGNVDTEGGAALDDTDWVVRSTAAGTTRLELDFTAQLFSLTEDGTSQTHSVVLDVEATPPDDEDGNARPAETSVVTLRHGDPSPYRLTFSRDLSATPGVWRVRVKRRTAPTTDAQREAAGRNGNPVRYDEVAWTAMRSFQPDDADYAGQRRLALRVRATGQLSGRLDRVSALVHQKVPTWDGTVWTAPARSSNPAWIFRWYALGIRIGGRLAAGVGLAAARIDDAAIKAWGAWCDAQGLTCNAVVDRDMTHAELLAAIAQCGRASPTWSTGRLGVVYDLEGQAATAFFGPGNIHAGSFEVDWASGAVADEIVCRYVDPDLDWQWNTVRRNVPGVASADRTATLTLWGVTDRGQAAKACNLQAARQLYHKRRLRWRTGPEGLAVDRGDVVHVSHALVDGGTTGRVLGGTAADVELSAELALSAGDMMLFRMPDGDLHTSAVSRPAGLDAAVVRLADPLPEAPGAAGSSPLDILWRHYGASGPPIKAKVVAVEPQGPDRVSITAIDEVPQYYAAATSDLTVDLPTLVRQPPAVVRIDVAERLVRAGGGFAVEIVATLAVEGDWRGGTVTARLDGGPARRVAQLQAGDLEARWIEPPAGTLRIRAVPGSAAAPSGRAADAVHAIAGTGAPPGPVQSMVATPAPGGYVASWDSAVAPDYARTEVWDAPLADVQSLPLAPLPAAATRRGSISGTAFVRNGAEPGTALRVWARHVDRAGNAGDPAHADVTPDAAAAEPVELWQVANGTWPATVPAVPVNPVQVDRAAGTVTGDDDWIYGKPAYDPLTQVLWRITADYAASIQPAAWVRDLVSAVGLLRANLIHTRVETADPPSDLERESAHQED